MTTKSSNDQRDAEQADKWLTLQQADTHDAAIRQAADEAQQAVEQALDCARQLDPDAELTTFRLVIQDIDHTISDMVAEAHDLTKLVGRQQDIIDDLHRQRDEALRQRDRALQWISGRRKRKL